MSWIVKSLLDTDFYKFTMGQSVFQKFRDVPVKYAFKNRTKSIELAKFIREEDLRRELDHVRTLRFNNSELHYIRGANEYGDRMFREDYLDFLRDLQLPPYDLKYEGDEITLEFSGKWSEAIYWETIALPIVNELYYRVLMENLTEVDRDGVYAQGISWFREKVHYLKDNPDIIFSDFGTRRRYSRKWQKYVVRILSQELSKDQFRGTSNVELAMKFGILPMGTSAHELFMVRSAIAGDDEEALRRSQNETLQEWWDLYGFGLSIALTDTFGSDFFFANVGKDVADQWKGLRQDSGDPIEFGEKALKWYVSHGVDPKNKLIIFSDGLNLSEMIKIKHCFNGRINAAFGWGTNLTNDLGIPALSLVIKPVEANGRGLVKLSDNLAKAVGKPEDIERVKKWCGYTSDYNLACKY